MASHHSLLLALLAPIPASASDLWVVDDDPGPGVDFATIQAAIDNAAEGDGILVREGDYPEFTIDGKTLSIFAAEGASPVVSAPGGFAMTVRGLGANQSVLLHGLTTDAGEPGPWGFIQGAHALLVTDNDGPVWLEDLEIENGDEETAAAVVASSSVVFVRCTIASAPTSGLLIFAFDEPRENGLFVHSSTVWAYDSQFVGRQGIGGPTSPWTAPDCADGVRDGGHGARLMGGASLFASGCTFAGGHGGIGDSPIVDCGHEIPGHGSSGGDGVRVEDTSTFEYMDTVLAPGFGGAAGFEFCYQWCNSGSTGSALEADPAATVIHHVGALARSLNVPSSPVEESSPFVLELHGETGDFVLTGFGSETAAFELPPTIGPLLLGLPFQTVSLGVLPTPFFQIPTAIGELPASVDFHVWYIQSVFATAQDSVLGAPAALIVVDSAF